MVFYVLTGRKGEGKTFLVKNLANQLKKEGLKVKGLITLGQEEKIFVSLADNQQVSLWQDDDKLEVEIGQFKFSKRAFEFARKIIGSISNSDVVIIDEIAWLEAEKKGLYQGVKNYLKNSENHKNIAIFVVRHQIVERIEDLFGITISKVWTVKKGSNESILLELKETCLREGGL